jgi:acyl-CoA synthetase (AMP-forming)/AMP-acid ligase II
LAGAWAINVNARLSNRELSVIESHCQPSLIYFTSDNSPDAAAHARTFMAQPCTCQALSAGNQFAVTAGRQPEENTQLARDVATLIYTSGTTGAPKGVMVPHAGLLHFARISASSRSLGPSDIAYAALPMSHIFGIATVLMATFYAGASLVLRSRFDAADVLLALQTPGLTILQGVPTMFVRILAQAGSQGSVQAPALRYVYTGGAALDLTLKRKLEALFGQPLHHGYGITEYAGSMFITDMARPRTDGSAGYAVEGVELRIVQNGQPVSPGEKGDILIRGPGVMLGYYRNPEQTLQALLPGGWLSTGDIGYVDTDGALFITGRSKDLIIRSGFNVYPQEVENVINAYPGIQLCAVVGKPAADGNEDVVAFYQPESGCSINERDLASYLSQHLAPYKRPALFVKVRSIPMTISGKIQKEPLRRALVEPQNAP